MFIQHLATKALDQAKSERKPRRNIQYKDIGNAYPQSPEPRISSC
jgi:DNA polymerase epsilon subunit 4